MTTKVLLWIGNQQPQPSAQIHTLESLQMPSLTGLIGIPQLAQKCSSCNGSGQHKGCGGKGCSGCIDGVCPDCYGWGYVNDGDQQMKLSSEQGLGKRLYKRSWRLRRCSNFVQLAELAASSTGQLRCKRTERANAGASCQLVSGD